VEEACSSLGFSPDTREFSAHLTLGRVKRALDAAALQSLEREVRRAHNEYSLDVRSVDLVQSEPRPGGSHYTTLASLPLHDVT
jgi:2'-5' RNA ligase